MGRGAHDKVNEQVLAGRPRGGLKSELLDEIELLTPETPDDIGSPAHCKRLGEYARARTGRFDVNVSLIETCMVCGHSYSKCHPGGNGCTECDCPKYISGGTSYTNMAGSIAVKADEPPRGPVEDREIVINGALRHEVCHELYTNPEAFRAMIVELEKRSKNKEEITATQLKHLWNILEDGMIEERERQLMPGSYRFIAARNKVWPKIPSATESEEIEHERFVPLPDGYIPTDIDGNELPVVTGPDGSKMVHIEPGVKLSVWGDKPVSLQDQAMTALFGMALPQYEPGQVHSTVQKAMDECQEHVDAAIRGNTSDCIARAHAIHAIFRKYDLLPEDLTEEEREQMEQLAQLYAEMGASAPSAPQPDADAQPQPGQSMQPMNGMPQNGGGMSQQLQQKMGGGSGQQGESGDDEQQSSAGGSSDSEDGSEQGNAGGGGGQQDKDDKDAQSEQGSGASGGGEDGDEEGAQATGKGDDKSDKDGDQQQAASKSGGKDDSAQDDADGDGNDGANCGQSQQQSSGSDERPVDDPFTAHTGGEGSGGNGFDSSRPIPKQAIARADKEKRGDVDQDDLARMRKEAKQNLDSDKATQIENDMRKLRGNQIEGSQYKFKSGENVTPQAELAASATRQGAALPDEQGELHAMGKQLAMRLKRIKSEARAPERRRMTGRLDSRAFSRGMAGDPKIYQRPGINLDMDLEIDVSIDRSISINQVMTEQQYRMAKMMALAAKDTKVPMTIYGWDGGYGQACNHYAFKERHSTSTAGIDALFQCGGYGTPTAEGIRFSRRRLANSQAQQKVMVVVTDGAANDISMARDQVRAAEKEGIEVIGMAFGCDKGQMDEQFGPGRWVDIDDFLEAPRIVGKLIERVAKERAKRR